MSKRTPLEHVYYALKLYSSGLSLRKTPNILSNTVKRNHVSVWNWIQKYKPKKILQKKNKVLEFIIDETLLKVSNQFVWVWIAIDASSKTILGIRISFERYACCRTISKLLAKRYGKRPVSTDGGTWYPQACTFLGLENHIHSSYEKSIIERTIQYIKDRTESFDDYFPCRKNNCKLEHVKRWLNLFIDVHNEMVIEKRNK